MVLLSFNINRNENSRGSLVFFTSHQHVTVFTKNNVIYNLDDSGGIWGHTTGNVWNFVKLPAYAEAVIVSETFIRKQPVKLNILYRTKK